MSVSKRIKEFLDSEHVPYEVLAHTTAFTAQEVAATAHISGRDVAKVVITKVGDQFYMAVVPASNRLDTKALQETLESESRPRLAEEKEFGSLFPDCELGAEPPFGNLYNLPVIIDQSLSTEPQIAFNAGNHRELIRIAFPDYKRLVKPKIGEIVVSCE